MDSSNGSPADDELGLYPASCMQTLFWRMQAAEPDSNKHVIVKGFRIRGRLDTALLRQAFESAVSRHAALRTVFVARDSGLLQRVLPKMPMEWNHVDVDAIQGYDDIDGLKKGFHGLLARPFDLENGPLLRVRLLSHGSDDHLIQLAVHHIVSDRRSILTLLDDLSSCYNTMLDGREPDIMLPESESAEYALLERRWLSSAEGAAGMRHWERSLEKGGMHHPWPSWSGAKDCTVRDGQASGVFEYALDSSLSAGMADFSKANGISRFQVMLGAYFLALQKLLPGKAVTVGVAMDIRRFLDEKPSIGCLINMLPITLGGQSPQRIDEYLKNASIELDEAIRHARVPYPAMLEAWTKKAGDSRSLRWKTMFNFKDAENGRLFLKGCTCETVHEFLNEILLEDKSSDLAITMTRTPGQKYDSPIRLFIRYDEGVLSSNHVASIVESWASVLRQCISSPEADSGSIQLPGVSGRYAKWQHALESPGARERLEAYWSERLSDIGETMMLLPDLTASNALGGRMESLSRSIAPSIHELMDVMCRQEGVGRHAAWMSVWLTLHSRLGVGEEVLISLPVEDPGQSSDETAKGVFLNTVPYRSRVDEQSTFRAFCQKNQLSLVGDLGHGQLPYDDIVRLADKGRVSRGEGLTQVMFVWNRESGPEEPDGIDSNGFPKMRFASNPLTVKLIERGDSCWATVEYNKGLFVKETIDSMLRRLEQVARQVLEDPGTRIGDIDILLPGERGRLRELSGRDNIADHPNTTLHDVFRQTADRYPDRPAVVDSEGKETSYAELQEQVRRVASFLRSKGIVKEAVVAVHLQRSPALLASMLGVSEAGGAFFLMEPSLPLDRLHSMAQQAGVALVVSEDGMPMIPGFSGITHLYSEIVDTDLVEVVEQGAETGPDALACVIFTSGSTGVPKGAMLEHANLLNYLVEIKEEYSFDSEGSTLQKTLLSFDASLIELMLPMITGGSVVVPEPGIEADIQRLAGIAEFHRVSYVFFAPAQLKLFLEVPGIERLNGSLKIVACGGESVSDSLVATHLKALKATLYQIYGPTETSIAVAQWKCRSGHGQTKPPLGRPNANVDILIMDPNGRPVPPGMQGELWIGGAQTGRGYINNEEETQRRFVGDPNEPGSGRRYYRTGDLARFLPDGNLLFIGRIDDQLKVRGVRIELGDVVAAIVRCEGVKDAVVLPEPDGEGSNRLRSWVTVKNGAVVSESSIRSSMKELLPGYMVPFRIHVIDSFPLTPHGKTDHRSLRTMAEKDEEGAEGLPLTTPTEYRLAAVWSELLGIEVLYRDVDFFRLGGHSLVAMRLAGHIYKLFGVTVSLTEFYTEGRLDRLAERIDTGKNNVAGVLRFSDMPAPIPGERVPMSGSQRRMWMLQHLLANPSSYHISNVFPMPRERSASEVKCILESMAERHGILRTLLFQEDKDFWQEERRFTDWNMDWSELDAGSQEECISLLSEVRERVFDLSSSPGWRAGYVRQKTGESLLLLVFHHALVDEWSMKLFNKEFNALLTGKVSPSMLDKPGYSYIDFSRWQQWTFSRGLRQRLESYWRERLSNMGEPVRITCDRLAADGGSGRSATVTRSIDTSIRHSMDAYCKREGLSRFAVWLCVWQILHSRLGSGEEVVIATPVSERDRPEWQDLMGMCLNTLPIRSKVDEQTSFRSFSKRSHISLAGDLSHSQLPYEDIVRLSDGELGMDGYGLPQVMFVHHGEYEWSEEEEEGALSAFKPKVRYAKNPITVHLTDRFDDCHAAMEYDADLFFESTTESILRRFEAIARQVMENPDIRIADIDILLTGERERLWELSGRGHVVPYPSTTLHDIFRQTAERFPDRPAVIEADGLETTYAELQEQVHKVTSFLRAQGIEKESVIAVHMQRSSSLLASMLGILEAGGAFFLMEPSLPLVRLRTMAEQARVVAVITEADMPIIPGFSVCTHRFNDILASNISGEFAINTSSDSTSLACVIFTSGSTGIPKGAMLEQENLYNYLLFLRDVYVLGPEVRTLHKTTLSFDPSLYELLLPMTVGGAVVLAGEGLENDTPHIVEMVERHHAGYLFFAPAQLRFFLQHPGLDRLNGTLKILQCAGEALEESLMEQCLSTLDASLSNAYGPAEAGAVTQWICHSGHPFSKPSIGKPNCNVDIWIMDRLGRPVPPGMSGELWIGGSQTGRGYINNAEETKKRFVDDPVDPSSGRRYYRTGDLAQFLPDGNLLFHGRMDDQLKVRGVRIELGDVTTALTSCNGVLEAVALPEPDGEGSNRLRAWVTVKEGSVVSEPSIRSSMTELLPSYMIPFRIHVVDKIPLTTHGKTDHRALKSMADGEIDRKDGRPLSTPTERRLAALWSELLGVEVESRDADFFRLGGHSLLMMRLTDRVRQWMNWKLPSRQVNAFRLQGFYGNPTLWHLAHLIEEEDASDEVDALSGFRPVALWTREVPVGSLYVTLGADAQMTGFSKYRHMAASLNWEWNVFALPDPQAVTEDIPDIPVEKLAEIYVDQILESHSGGPIVLFGECLGGTDAFAAASILDGMTKHSIHIFMADTTCPKWTADTTAGESPGPKGLMEAITESRLKLRKAYPFRNWKGDLHLFTNQFMYEANPLGGWQDLVEGRVFTRRLTGDHSSYLFDHLEENMTVIDEALSIVLNEGNQEIG